MKNEDLQKLTRYDMSAEYNKYACEDVVKETAAPDGELVKYSDVCAISERQAAGAMSDDEARTVLQTRLMQMMDAKDAMQDRGIANDDFPEMFDAFVKAFDQAAAQPVQEPPSQQPVAYLKEWDSVGHARKGMRRVDLTSDCEPWLANMYPTITPLYANPYADSMYDQLQRCEDDRIAIDKQLGIESDGEISIVLASIQKLQDNILNLIETDHIDAERWRFTMTFQVHPSVERPGAMAEMWRKVLAEGRLRPTREEYEAATDASIAASRQPKPE